MNTLNLIKKQINKAAALHDAQINHTAYRGIVTKVTNVKPNEVHGKFTYRVNLPCTSFGLTFVTLVTIPRYAV